MSADNKNWDTSLLAGSVKRNIVNPDITEERAKCNFDQKEIASFVIGDQTLSEMKLIREATKDDPAFHDDLHYYELSREEQMSIWWRRVKAAYENPALKHYFTENHTNTNLGF
jgi:acyl-CoA oxidase